MISAELGERDPPTVAIDLTSARTRRAGLLQLDLGVIGVKDRWRVGFGARGVGNRMTWTGVEQTTYTLASVTSGITSFLNAGAVPAADRRIQLPVDYRGADCLDAA